MALHVKELLENVRNRIGALYKNGLGYKKIDKSLKPCWTVANVIHHFFTGTNRNRPHQGRTKESTCPASYPEVDLKKEYCQNCCRGQLTVLRLYDTHCVILVWMAVIPKGSLFWSWNKNPCKQFAEDKHSKSLSGSMTCGLTRTKFVCLRWCPACVVVPCWGVPKQLLLAYSQGWSCAAWVLLALGSWIPTCTVTFWSRAFHLAVFHH